MMRQMMGGGGMPGMPAIPGMRRAATKSAKGKKDGKKKPKGGRPGGNPAAKCAAAQGRRRAQAGDGAARPLPGLRAPASPAPRRNWPPAWRR